MKKITSIFSLGLLLSTSLLLGSCGDCESGPGCDGSGASSATVEELKQKVNEQANQIAALSSEVEAVPYTIYQDADGKIWLGNMNDPSQKREITAGLKGPKGDPGAPVAGSVPVGAYSAHFPAETLVPQKAEKGSKACQAVSEVKKSALQKNRHCVRIVWKRICLYSG